MTNPPLTDDQIDAFIEGRIWVLRKGTDTGKMAARIIRRLYEDRRALRAEVAELKARMGMETTKWTDKATKER